MPSKFAPYKAALEALSKRTQTPLPSLIVSFAILHEATAVAPLISVFFLAKSLGVGERAVDFVNREISEDSNHQWLRQKGAKWVDEGEQWAGRVGRRYGIFGFSKTPVGSNSDAGETLTHLDSESSSYRIAGDVANAVLAYGITKALLPARIALSLYFSPAFSRSTVEPIRSLIVGIWRRPPQ